MLLFFWMIIIFVYSAQPAAESSKLSGQVVTGLQEAGKSFSILDRLLSWGRLEFLVRKTAHVMEYAVLGSLVLFNIENWFSYKKKRFYLLFSTGFCVIYAASDELHQYFVPFPDPPMPRDLRTKLCRLVLLIHSPPLPPPHLWCTSAGPILSPQVSGGGNLKTTSCSQIQACWT